MQKELTKYLIPDIGKIVCEYATFDTDKFQTSMSFIWLMANLSTNDYDLTVSAKIVYNLHPDFRLCLGRSAKDLNIRRQCIWKNYPLRCCYQMDDMCWQCKDVKQWEKEEKARLRELYLLEENLIIV